MTKENRLNILREILSAVSANKNQGAVPDCLQKHLASAGIPCKQREYAPGGNSLIAEFGGGKPLLALAGHLECTADESAAAPTAPPFAPREGMGRLYGAGAAGMACGLAAMAIAMMELSCENTALNGRLRLLATTGGEAILPDAETLAKVWYTNDVDAMIIAAPTGHRIVYAHKGICTYTVTAHGKSAHSSAPGEGINAIDNLMVFYQCVMEEFAKLAQANAALGEFTWCNSLIQGGERFDTVPEKASLTANLCTIPEVDNNRVIGILQDTAARLNATVPGMLLELEIVHSTRPVVGDAHSKLIKAALTAARKVLGRDIPVLGSPDATGAAKLIQASEHTQAILLGPNCGAARRAGSDEDLQNALEMVEIYINTAKAYFES